MPLKLAPRNWRLRTRLLVTLLTFATLPLAIAATFSVRQSSDALTSRIQTDFRAQAESRAQRISDFLAEQARILQLFSTNTNLFQAVQAANRAYPTDSAASAAYQADLAQQWQRASSPDDIVASRIHGPAADELYRLRQLVPDQAEVLLTDAHGSVVAATSQVAEFNHSHKDWWKEVWTGGTDIVHISQPTSSETPGLWGVVIAVPILNQTTQQTVGVLRSTYRISALQQVMGTFAGADLPHSRILDRANVVIASTDSSEIGQPLPEDLLRQLQSSEDGASNGLIVAASPMRNTTALGSLEALQWRSIVSQERAVALSPVTSQILGTLLTGLLVALAAGVVALVLGRRLTGPLAQLAHAAQNDDLTVLAEQPVVRGDDEVGQMAQSLRGLAQRLLASRREIEATNRDLEAMVVERTASLQEALNIVEQRESHLAETNTALAQARDTAEQANKLKSQFLATMSHELRTPLNSIINFTRIMMAGMAGPVSTEQADYMSRVRFSGEHLLGIINDILDISKIEAGLMELSYKGTNLNGVVRDVVASTRAVIADKPIELLVDLPPALPMVWVDQMRMRQVLLNLLSNAAKFTRAGSITLKISTHDSETLLFAVSDTGIGIDPDHQHLIFEEFRQVQGDLTREYQGTGLGLPISRRLIEMHGGEMWLESAVGMGSTFFFTLPMGSPDLAAASQPASPPIRGSPAPTGGNGDPSPPQPAETPGP